MVGFSRDRPLGRGMTRKATGAQLAATLRARWSEMAAAPTAAQKRRMLQIIEAAAQRNTPSLVRLGVMRPPVAEMLVALPWSAKAIIVEHFISRYNRQEYKFLDCGPDSWTHVVVFWGILGYFGGILGWMDWMDGWI